MQLSPLTPTFIGHFLGNSLARKWSKRAELIFWLDIIYFFVKQHSGSILDVSYRTQRRIQNLVKHLQWNFTRKFLQFMAFPLLGSFTVVGMKNFQYTFETRKWSFISNFSICKAVCLTVKAVNSFPKIVPS